MPCTAQLRNILTSPHNQPLRSSIFSCPVHLLTFVQTFTIYRSNLTTSRRGVGWGSAGSAWSAVAHVGSPVSIFNADHAFNKITAAARQGQVRGGRQAGRQASCSRNHTHTHTHLLTSSEVSTAVRHASAVSARST